MNGKLIIIAAPSGAGKTTIVKHILANNSHLEFSISSTTRKKRGNETDGKDYYFISEAEFKKKIANQEFIEWQEVYHGIFYGSLKKEVERIWKNNKQVVFDIDVQGALNLKKIYSERALSIFIKTPTKDVLYTRLMDRETEDPKSLAERIQKAESELQYENKFDAVVVNDNLEEAIQKTEKLIKDFCSKS